MSETLSDKIRVAEGRVEIVKHVREFIQKLDKLDEKFINFHISHNQGVVHVGDVRKHLAKRNKLAGEELANHSPQEMVTSVTGRPEDLLCECGALEDRHPIIMIADNKDIGCKKFELANHSPAKKIKGLMNDLEAGKFEDTQKGCEYCDGRGYFYKSIQYPCPKCSGEDHSQVDRNKGSEIPPRPDTEKGGGNYEN